MQILCSRGVEARVRGPQEGEHLTHRGEGLRNCLSPNRSTTFGGLAIADSGREDLEEHDGICSVAELGIGVEGAAEVDPFAPGFGSTGNVALSERRLGRCFCSVEITEESHLGRNGYSRQGFVCG